MQMRELDRKKWLPVESKQAIELVQLELQRQKIEFKKQIGLLTVMLFDLSKPYSDGSKSYDRIIYRKI
jgi:hypothetical protein